MNPVPTIHLSRLQSLAVLTTVLAFADCGGKTDADLASTGGSGGTSSNVGHAGQAVGGATSADRTETQCHLAADSGSCEAYLQSYWHDSAIGVCRPFVYGGCGGNDNHFVSLAQCQSVCRGVEAGATELDLCVSHSDCQLAPTSCCGGCDPAIAWDFVVVATTSRELWQKAADCVDVMCEACLPVAPVDRTARYLQVQCVSGQCTLRDVRESEVTECQTASDCRLRCGTRCCPSCNSIDIIAVRADTNDSATFCGDEPQPCENCVCEPPSSVVADCVNNRCVVLGEAICTVGADQTCNDNPAMSALAGICNDNGTCTCASGRTKNPTTGRCF